MAMSASQSRMRALRFMLATSASASVSSATSEAPKPFHCAEVARSNTWQRTTQMLWASSFSKVLSSFALSGVLPSRIKVSKEPADHFSMACVQSAALAQVQLDCKLDSARWIWLNQESSEPTNNRCRAPPSANGALVAVAGVFDGTNVGGMAASDGLVRAAFF